MLHGTGLHGAEAICNWRGRAGWSESLGKLESKPKMKVEVEYNMELEAKLDS